jgi:D-alanyl-lipoteichoic acid acyltransferase DltB (MBOAT superfamily)
VTDTASLEQIARAPDRSADGVDERLAPRPAWRRALPLAVVAAQVGLLALAIHRFNIESRAFTNVFLIALGGFVVHALLPLRHRLPFFVFLSIASILAVMGPANGAWLIAAGLGLIGLCHLPGPAALRIAALLAAGGALAFLRSSETPLPWSAAIWPILGSMFMFRLIVYMYDLRHEKERPGAVRTLAYFFMLPNVCFPLFPVVDFKTFRRTHFDGDAARIYQVGAHWMLRGIVQLLVYRLIYTNLTLDPSQVQSGFDLARFLVTNFLLYLRVSGLFHLVVGMLHLFGFNLPETNQKYALSSSFTDFWRRINIYWKDFMMKIFYYPLFFRLRRRGATFALVASTIAVFVVTWALHSYQWFWIRGAFPVTPQDVFFWGILCALVVANSLYEDRFGRKRTLGKKSLSARDLAVRGLFTVGTFAAVCVLWSLWTCDSLGEWARLWTSLARAEVFSGVFVAGALLAVAGGPPRLGKRLGGAATAAAKPYSFVRHAALTTAGIVLLLAASAYPVYSRLGPTASSLLESLRSQELSRRDAAALERGYYENLLEVRSVNSQLWEVFMKRPQWPLLHETPAARQTGDFFGTRLNASTALEYHGAAFHTNRWEMRDRDYDLEKPAGVYRIALLGSSHVMGSGVADEQTFENRLEDSLDARAAAAGRGCEILNFAIAGYKPTTQVAVLEESVWRFSPDAVMYVAHAHEREEVIRRVAEMVRNGVDLRYPELREAVRKAGIDAKTPEAVAARALEPLGGEILAWVYGRIAGDARARGARSVWVYIPRVTLEPEAGGADLFRTAQAAGFSTVDLTDVYGGHDAATLRVAEWDHHPNAEGHRLLAARLLRAIDESDGLFPPEITGSAGATPP